MQNFYSYCVQTDDHEIESSEFIRAKGGEKSGNKELRFSDNEKCVHGTIKAPITTEQVSFRSIKHAV